MRKSEQLGILIRKIENIFTLANEEEAAIAALPMRILDLKKGQAVARQGDRPTQCCLVLSGATCISKVSGAGQRQIMIYHFPGDMPDLQSLHLNVLDMTLAAQSTCRVGLISHEHVRALGRTYPRIGDALWRMTLIDAAIFREWLLNIGQRPAHARMAHFLCEMAVRMELAGLGREQTYPFPLTQQDIGATLGLSHIHVNRVTQDLRRDGLIELGRNTLRIKNWRRLREAADFSLAYLNLTKAQRLTLTGGYGEA